MSFVLKAQPPSRFYTKFGGAGIDIGYGVKTTLDKQYIVVGSTSSYGAGSTDVYLVKVDSMGLPIWGKTFGGFGNDVGRSVIQLPDSGYVIAGFTNSFGAGGYDAYVVRTDKLGALIWQKTFGGLDWDFAYDLVYSSDGNIVFCGTTTSYGHGNMDGFVCKFDLSGTQVWQKFYGGVEDDVLKAVITKNGSDFYLAGSTKSFGDLNGDMLCYKVDNNGDSLLRIIHGGPQWDAANSVALGSGNDIILAGGTMSTTANGKDALFARFDPAGNFIIQKTQGYSGDEEAFKIINSPTANLAETMAIYTTHEIPSYGMDTKTIYINTALDWFGGQGSGKFGFPGDEEFYDFAATKDKGCIEVGYTTSLGAVDKDIFLVKADSTLEEDFSIVGVPQIRAYKTGIGIYPNPVPQNADLQISLPTNDKFLIVLTSITGSVLFQQLQEGTIVQLPFKSLESGVYFISIKAKEQSATFKIIKQ